MNNKLYMPPHVEDQIREEVEEKEERLEYWMGWFDIILCITCFPLAAFFAVWLVNNSW